MLIAYVKSGLTRDMLASELPDDAAFAGRLPAYFPVAMRERFPAAVAEHPLRREIVTTMAVNHLVNGAGITFAFRLGEEMAAGPTDALRVYEVATAVYGLPELWTEIAGRSMPATAQNQIVLLSRRLLDRAARWLLVRRPQPLDVRSEIARYQPVVAELSRSMPRLLCGSEFARVHVDAADLRAHGIPADLALKTAYALYTFSLLDITDVADETGREPAEVAELYYALSEHIGLDRILSSVSALDRGDRWHCAGTAGHPGRPLQLTARDHRRCALHHGGRSGRRGQDRSVGGGESVPPGARPDHPRSDREFRGGRSGRAVGGCPRDPFDGPMTAGDPAVTAGTRPMVQRHVTDVRVRYSDLDAQGHVNNARVITLLEEARVDWLYPDATRRGAHQLVRAIVVATLEIQYRRPIPFGRPARVSIGVTAIGGASFTVEYVVTTDGVLAATASTVLVVVGPADGRPQRLGDAERAFLECYRAPYTPGEPPTPRAEPDDAETEALTPGYAAWSR